MELGSERYVSSKRNAGRRGLELGYDRGVVGGDRATTGQVARLSGLPAAALRLALAAGFAGLPGLLGGGLLRGRLLRGRLRGLLRRLPALLPFLVEGDGDCVFAGLLFVPGFADLRVARFAEFFRSGHGAS